MLARRGFVGGAALLAGGAGVARAADPLRVAFVYTGPVGDWGYSHQQEQGRLALAAALGPRVATSFVESVAEGPDGERVLGDLAAAGNRLIFSTSFGFQGAALRVARRFPAVRFEQEMGERTAPNLAEIDIRWYEGYAVCGTIAGHLSRSGVCGYVAPFPVPQVVLSVNAFTLAARRVNPRIAVRIIWTDTWFDPGREADAATSLIDGGADIVVPHTDSPAVVQTAEARGVHAFGVSSDMARFGPRAQLTAVVNHWDPYMIARAKAVLDGSWAAGARWAGFRDDLLRMAPYGPGVSPALRTIADRARTDIAAGTLHPFEGPVRDRAGAVRIAAAQRPSDPELRRMEWFVEGVSG